MGKGAKNGQKKVKFEGKPRKKNQPWVRFEVTAEKNGSKRCKNGEKRGKKVNFGSFGMVWSRWRGNFGVTVLGNGSEVSKNG